MTLVLPRRSFSLDFCRDGQASGDNYADELSKLDSIVNFARSTTATRYNSAGVLETLAAGQPRFDFNPVTLACNGLLIEEARTNLLLNSATLATQAVSVTAQAYALTFWGSGTVTLSGAYSGSLVGTGAGNRVSLTFTPGAGTLTLTVSGTISNAQLETGAFATSYIPTTSAAITRAADLLSISNFTPWYNAAKGSWIVCASVPIGSGTRRAFLNMTTVSDGYSPMLAVEGNDEVRGLFIVSGVYQFDQSDPITTTSLTKAALVYNPLAYRVCVNGHAPIPGSYAGVPAAPSVLGVGQSPGGGDYLNGYLRSLIYLPYAVSDLLLKQLTT